ncbi:MAG: hypothetical protein H6Q90_2609 [Deltaproteobacteria bacterium]|nr:hypothetical protein [Deltaproteobacteria bacterium]
MLVTAGEKLVRVLGAAAIATVVVIVANTLRDRGRADATRELDDPNPRVRAAAASRLGASKHRGARALLEHALLDREDTVRIAAATALCELGDRAALPVLREAMLDEEDAGVRAVIESTIERLAGGSSAT